MIKTHKMSVHEGIKYQCDQFVLKCNRKSYLMKHKMSVMKVCVYKASTQGSLKRHKKISSYWLMTSQADILDIRVY